ncbi:MAG: glycosidase [Bacteroidia bacterium]|nr:glycosidase [Bacteroidia bacterium]
MSTFSDRILELFQRHEALIHRSNEPLPDQNGIYTRYRYPILTGAHAPIFWRYDLNESSNPHLMERQGVNAALNSGAIFHEGRYLMVVRTEGVDRKSFFAMAESPNGIDRWRFWDHPIVMPETDNPDTNVYDMRLTLHQDGWIYGVFCTERKDPNAPAGDTSAADAQAGIARTRDFVNWERLPDLKSPSAQQRNVVLHPEFVEGKYAFYTRPQDGFIGVGGGGGIGFGACDDVTNAVIDKELVMDPRLYHTIKEVKNGQGPAPLKTAEGWLHLAHGVRNTAAGLRYVLYTFMSDLQEPWRITHAPAGHFIAPEGEERVGDVSNVVFSNGWILNDSDEVFVYYGSSDTRMHVATTTLEKLIDYTINTPVDRLRSAASVETRIELINKNLQLMKGMKLPGRE